MEGWLIISKLFIVAYVAGVSVEANIYNLSIVILFLLIYLSLNLYRYIINNKNIISIILVTSIGALIIGGSSFNSVLMLLIPINLFELTNLNNIKKEIGFVLGILPLVFLKNFMWKEYLLIATLSYVICTISYIFDMKFTKLVDKNDFLREDNYLLKQNMIKDTEYENQLMYTSQLEERNKIAQEIHDNVGHTISSSLMQLEATKLIMDKDKNKANEMLQNTINVLRDGMENIRATLKNIKPPFEQIGINRLKLIMNQYEVSSKIKADLYYEGTLKEITHIQWGVINRSVKEALTNTMKYAKATEVRVRIQILNKLIKVEIMDNGVGNRNIKKGLGLRGIEERCENLNGKIILDGSEGFSVIMLLPIISQ